MAKEYRGLGALNERVDFIGSGALVYSNTDRAISNLSETIIIFDEADYDDLGFWNASSPSIFTIPSGVNRVRVTSAVNFDNNTNGFRRLNIQKNGNTNYKCPTLIEIDATAGGSGDIQATSPIISVSEGDTFRVTVQQSSGGSLNCISGANNNITFMCIEVIS